MTSFTWVKTESKRLGLVAVGHHAAKKSWRLSIKIFVGAIDDEVRTHQANQRNKRKSDDTPTDKDTINSSSNKSDEALHPADKEMKKDWLYLVLH